MGRPRECVWDGLVSAPPSFTCTLVFLLTFLFLFLLMSLRWASFGHSTLLPARFTQIPGRPFKPFALLCDVMRLHPTPSCFLSYYNSHPAKKAAWHSLASRPGSVLFDLFALSYKSFKERFVKVVIRPEAPSFFFYSTVGLGSPFIGLDSLVILRSGRGRRRVRTSWVSLPFLTPSRGGFRAGS